VGIAITKPERIRLGYRILELRSGLRLPSVDRRKPGAGSSGRRPASSPLYRPDLHSKRLAPEPAIARAQCNAFSRCAPSGLTPTKPPRSLTPTGSAGNSCTEPISEFAADSPLEIAGFEPSVPPPRRAQLSSRPARLLGAMRAGRQPARRRVGQQSRRGARASVGTADDHP
jgi:hypothetical protein